jgi:hypothetical protein
MLIIYVQQIMQFRAIYTQFYGTIYVFNGISGSGSMLTDLNASNITSGTLTISRGGIGTSSLKIIKY